MLSSLPARVRARALVLLGLSASCSAPPAPRAAPAAPASVSPSPSSSAAPSPPASAVPAAAAAVPPIDNLSVTRTFDHPPGLPLSYLRATGDGFLGFSGIRIFVYGPDRSAPAASYPTAFPGATRPVSLEYTDRTLDGAWLPVREAEMARIDARTGALRWRTPLYPGAAPDPRRSITVFPDELARDGAVLLAALSAFGARTPPWEIVGLDWESGAVLWRQPLRGDEGVWALRAAGGRGYALLRTGVLRAFDPRSGRVLWERRLPPAKKDELHTLVATPRAVVVATPRSLEVTDAASGAPLRAIAVPGRLDTGVQPIVEGDTLFGVVLRPPAPPLPDVFARAVTAIDLATGTVRAQSSEVLVPARADGSAERRDPLVVDADGVYTCFQDDALRAFDRATLAPRFHLGLGSGCATAFLDPDATGVRPIVAARYDGVMELLTRGPAPMPAERARVVGRVRGPSGAPWARRPVLVDGAAVLTDALGRFDVTVTARGVVDVTVPARRLSGNTRLLADGRAGPYEVDLRLAAPGPVD